MKMEFFSWDFFYVPVYGVKTEIYPAGIYLFKVTNGNTRTMCEIRSKLNNKDTRMTSFWCLYCSL